jgi:hypothetical protein
MVAITVILAAVIGAFVLEIGDQQEIAPKTSFDANENTGVFHYEHDNPMNMTYMEISHAGGDVLDVGQSEIKAEGNGSVWGNVGPGEYGPPAGSPVPNFLPTLGTNEPAEFSSGEEWMFWSYGGEPYWNSPYIDESKKKWWWPSDEVVAREHPCNNGWLMRPYEVPDPNQPRLNDGWCTSGHRFGNALRNGDTVTVVWEASSGGKTQTLYKYTIQNIR